MTMASPASMTRRRTRAVSSLTSRRSYKDTFRFIRGDEANPDKTPLTPGNPFGIGLMEFKDRACDVEAGRAHPGSARLRCRRHAGEGAPGRQGRRTRDSSHPRAGLERVRADFAAHKDATGCGQNKKPSMTFKDVQQILNVKCRQCHGGTTQATSRSGLILTSQDGALQGRIQIWPRRHSGA